MVLAAIAVVQCACAIRPTLMGQTSETQHFEKCSFLPIVYPGKYKGALKFREKK